MALMFPESKISETGIRNQHAREGANFTRIFERQNDSTRRNRGEGEGNRMAEP